MNNRWLLSAGFLETAKFIDRVHGSGDVKAEIASYLLSKRLLPEPLDGMSETTGKHYAAMQDAFTEAVEINRPSRKASPGEVLVAFEKAVFHGEAYESCCRSDRNKLGRAE